MTNDLEPRCLTRATASRASRRISGRCMENRHSLIMNACAIAGTRHGRVKALSDDRRYQTRARDPPDLHRAPASAHARLCQLERAETAGHSPPADHKALSADAAADAPDDFERGPWGPKFRPALRPGAAFGRTSFVLRLFPDGSPRRLHHQRAGERARAVAEDHQDPGRTTRQPLG